MSKKFVSKENLSTFWGKVKALVSANVTTAGTGLSKSGTTMSHQNYGSAGTAGTSSATSGSTLAVPYVTTNAQGHVTGKGTHTHTVTGFAASSHTHAASDITDANKIRVYRRLDSSYNFEFPFLVGDLKNMSPDPNNYVNAYSLIGSDSNLTPVFNPYAKKVAFSGLTELNELRIGHYPSGSEDVLKIYSELWFYSGSKVILKIRTDGVYLYDSSGNLLKSKSWANILS